MSPTLLSLLVFLPSLAFAGVDVSEKVDFNGRLIRFTTDSTDGNLTAQTWKKDAWVPFWAGLKVGFVRRYTNSFLTIEQTDEPKLIGTTLTRPGGDPSRSENKWYVHWNLDAKVEGKETRAFRAFDRKFDGVVAGFEDGSYVFQETSPSSNHMHIYSPEDRFTPSPLNRSHQRGWEFTPTGASLFLTWEGWNKKESPWFRDYTPGFPYTLFYSQDGKSARKLLTEPLVSMAVFVNSGRHIVYWVPADLKKKENRGLWHLHSVNVATGVSRKLDSREVKLVDKGYINSGPPFFIYWSNSPWVLYGSGPEEPQKSYRLVNAETGETKDIRLPGQEQGWALSEESMFNGFGKKSYLILNLVERPHVWVRGLEMPELKEIFTYKADYSQSGPVFVLDE